MSDEKHNASDKECRQAAKEMPLPDVDFSTFILSMSSSAMVLLGELPEPETGQVNAKPHLAKQTIDVLAMLKDKFANGLSEDESKLLADVLCHLRMKYVSKA